MELFDLEIPIRSTGGSQVKADFKSLETAASQTAAKVEPAMERTAQATAGVTASVGQAADALRRIGVPADQVTATLKRMGFSANEVERELREVVPAATQTAAALGNASTGIVNVTRTSNAATPVLNRMRNVMSAGVATAIGMSGAVGSLGGALLAFAGGTGPALLAVAVIGSMLAAIQLLTKGMREAAAEQDAFTDGLVQQARDHLPDATKATQALAAAVNELADADERVAKNQGVQRFIDNILGGRNGDPVAKLLGGIVRAIGRIPEGRQREAATAVNQGQINQRQALLDFYVREAELLAETIQIRGKDAVSLERVAAMQAFLTAEAQKSIYTLPQQNALLQANASITDALTDKTVKRTTATRTLADVEAERTKILLALLQLETPTAERWAELRTRADAITVALAAGNVPLEKRVELLRELASIEAATGFGGNLPVDPIGIPRPPLRTIEPPTQEDIAAPAVDDSLFEGDSIGARIRRSIVESGKTVEEAAAEAQAVFMQAGASLGMAFQQGIVGAFEALGQGAGIGETIAQFTGQMLSAIGTMAIEFGLAAIGIGALMEKIMASLASLNPIVAIAAGAALVALGSALKGAASKSFGGGSASGSRSLAPITNTFRVSGSALAQPSASPVSAGVPSPAPKMRSPINVTYFGKSRDPGFSRWLHEQVSYATDRGL